jgi:NTP pyrophosphatase (non-canonical NTP hydrolase)
MTADRSIKVLTAGLKAAHERMFSDSGLRRPEYPRNLQKMYSNMEDAAYELFDAVQVRDCAFIRKAAADVIIAASNIVEYAELLKEVTDKPWDTEGWKK